MSVSSDKSKTDRSLSKIPDLQENPASNDSSVSKASSPDVDLSNEDHESACNAEIGARIRNVRLLLGFTQSAFSSLMNVTFQQIQKYEKGLNRVSAAALWRLSEKLGISISHFFPQNDQGEKKLGAGVAEDAFSFDFEKNLPKKNDRIKEINSLLSEFKKLKKAKVRKKVISLLKTIAESEADSEKEANSPDKSA